jgi:hypothetical protein
MTEATPSTHRRQHRDSGSAAEVINVLPTTSRDDSYVRNSAAPGGPSYRNKPDAAHRRRRALLEARWS